MKKIKKMISFLLMTVLVFAMALTAFAGNETYTLTITGTKAGHMYAVYQIFTGDISGTSPNYVLSNVKYGKNYGVEGNAVSEDTLKAITDADTFAKNVVVTGDAYKTVSSTEGDTVINGLPAGYYLVKDTVKISGQDAATKYILQVVGDTTVAVKSSVPTVEKKVKENVKAVAGTTDARIPDYTLPTQYNDVADYNIGDDVPFELIGTLPDNLVDYTDYKYYFHDTLSEGLTYNNDAKVYVDNNGTKTDITGSFHITCTESSLKIKCENIKGITGVTKDSKIVVDYTARLNASAQIGLPGNENEVYLEFSNNPNQGGEGDTGTTPKDQVIVFTYELDVTKVDGKDNSKKLEGAEFKLHNESGKWAVVENGKVTGWADTEEAGTALTSGADGKFVVSGLDDGTYYLKETKAPTGYNKLTNEIELVITAATVNNQEWKGTPAEALTALKINVGEKAEADGDTSTGVVNAAVENNQGSSLPSTGGMGTALFYIIGGILAAGAVVLLITRKRMGVEK